MFARLAVLGATAHRRLASGRQAIQGRLEGGEAIGIDGCTHRLGHDLQGTGMGMAPR